jgi:hypothetical protein
MWSFEVFGLAESAASHTEQLARDNRASTASASTCEYEHDPQANALTDSPQ